MTKIHYHTVGVAFYVVGLVLLIWMQPEEQSSILFGQSPIIFVLAGGFQSVGILLFLKWLKKEREPYFSVYQKYYPVILAFLLLGVPVMVNQLLATTAKTFAYSDPNGTGTVEYVANKSSCHLSADQCGIVECTVTLKNYEHASKKVDFHLSFDQWIDQQEVTVHLLQRQEKQVKIELPITGSETIHHLKEENILIPELTLTRS